MSGNTTHYNLPLPAPENVAAEDAVRLRTALIAIDTAIKAVSDAVQAIVIPPATESEDGLVRLASAIEAETGTHPTAVMSALQTRLRIEAAIAALSGDAPGDLDTIEKLAASIGDDPDFAATMASALAGKQPLAGNLTALAGLAGAANRLAYFTGAGTMSLATLTAVARTLLAATDQPAQRAALGLATVAATGSYADLSEKPALATAASQAEAQAGLASDRGMTPLRTAQAIAALAGAALAVVYTSSQTITIPTGATKALVKLWGGGGGGAVSYYGGGGGGVIKLLTGLTAGNTLSLAVGAGGGNTSGGNAPSGGNTVLSSGTQAISTLTAGGGGGGSSSTQTQGVGGSASGGDFNVSGVSGAFGLTTAFGMGSGGVHIASIAANPGGCLIYWLK